MTGNTAKKQLTYDDLLELPEGTKAEIINGQLEVAAAKPTFRHRRVTY